MIETAKQSDTNTVAVIPAFHVFYAPADEVAAVSAWFDANDAWDVSATHEIRVEDGPDGLVMTYRAPAAGFVRHGNTRAAARPCTPPPAITTLPRLDLHDLFMEHGPAVFPLHSTAHGCHKCTEHLTFVPWPCPTVVAAVDAVSDAA